MATQQTPDPAPTVPTAIDEPRTAVERMARKTQKMIERARDAEAERDSLRAKLDEMTKQFEPMKTASSEVETLKAELRTLKHRSLTDQLLRESGLDTPKKLEAFYKLSEMKFEGDAPDEAKVREFLAAQQDTLDLLRGNPAPEAPLIKPGAGRGQGGNGTPDDGKVQVTQQQLRDPNWCFQNQGILKKAAEAVGNLPVSQVGDRFSII